MQLTAYRYFSVRSKKKCAEISFKNGEYNYITPEVLKEMERVIADVCRLDDVHSAVLRSGTPGVFSRGLEIKSVSTLKDQEKIEFIAEARRVLSQLNSAKIPFLCSIDGDCFGAGLELMLSCDIRIASYTSKFGAPEVIFGLLPTDEGIRRLLSMVGRGQASRLLLTGMTISAEEALRVGLIEEAVTVDSLEKRCWDLAERLGRIQRPGIMAVKKEVQRMECLYAGSLSKNVERKEGIYPNP